MLIGNLGDYAEETKKGSENLRIKANQSGHLMYHNLINT